MSEYGVIQLQVECMPRRIVLMLASEHTSECVYTESYRASVGRVCVCVCVCVCVEVVS